MKRILKKLLSRKGQKVSRDTFRTKPLQNKSRKFYIMDSGFDGRSAKRVFNEKVYSFTPIIPSERIDKYFCVH